MASHPPLPDAVDAERRQTEGRARRLAYYVDGDGPPVLLLHSVNAAASAYEMKPVFERLRDRFRVYAVDLPGFGHSDRSDRTYDVRLYVDAVHDMLDVIAAEDGRPVLAMALSLASEFLARAAVEAPDRFRGLVLVTPTGLNRSSDRLRRPGTREVPGFLAIFKAPPWGRPLYRLLTSRSSIRYFLRRTYGSKDVHEDMADYDYASSHQPGAEHAPYAFLSGRLFSTDIRAVYEQLEIPVFVPHGTRGDFKDFSGAGWAESRPNWTLTPFATGALPHWQAPNLFFDSLDGFIAQLPGV